MGDIRLIDRADAGRRLARALERYREEAPVVLGLPRGGVVVAAEIAEALDAPLDVLVVRKVGAPGREELAVGAVAPGGVTLADDDALRRLGISDEAFRQRADAERAELHRRLGRFRSGDALPDVEGRTVIVVDDGLATGFTAEAAVHALRAARPRRVVLAVGAGARETAERLADRVDDVVCALVREPFRAVGLWYHDFDQTTDEEVVRLLDDARERIGSA